MVDDRDRRKCIDRRIQRRLANQRLVGRLQDLEHDQDRIADELQDLAAARGSGGGAVLEVVVEQAQQLVGGQRLAQGGEAAQVRVPERGADLFAVAAFHLPMQDPFADAVAHEGVEQAQRGAPQGEDLEQRRQQVRQRDQAQQVGRAETLRGRGGERDRVAGAGPEHHRQRNIVRHTFGAHLLQQRVLVVLGFGVEALAKHLPVLVHELHRAAHVGIGFLHAVAPVRQLRAGGPIPDHAQGQQLRVQGAARNPDPVDMGACGVELCHQRVQQHGRIPEQAALGQQPHADRHQRPAVGRSEQPLRRSGAGSIRCMRAQGVVRHGAQLHRSTAASCSAARRMSEPVTKPVTRPCSSTTGRPGRCASSSAVATWRRSVSA